MESKLIYSPKYDMAPPGASIFHLFDGQKYSKAWRELQGICNVDLESIWQEAEQPVSDEALLNIHSAEYLTSLNRSSVVSRIVEIPLARFVPGGFLQRHLIQPMKFACEGTRLATELALDGAMVMNIGGGFHHAHATHGEGFCVFADVAVAIMDVRKRGSLKDSDKILMIDLDAHRGNGFESIFRNDPSVEIFDMYNFQVYPGMHQGDLDDHPFMLPLKNKTNDDVYLSVLKEELPRFLSQNKTVKLIFYNAGTDILAGDPLGNMSVSYKAVVEREKFVVKALSDLNVPTVVVTSGGYTKTSYKLVAELARLVVGG